MNPGRQLLLLLSLEKSGGHEVDALCCFGTHTGKVGPSTSE